MTLRLPELSLVLLIGASGSGKSTFARKHFKPTEVVSSDVCRGIVSDDENDQAVTPQAFELLNFILRQRLALGKFTVVDATNLNSEDRAKLVAIAREFHVLPAALVFRIDEKICQERNAARPDRDFGPHVLKRQFGQLRRGLRGRKGLAQKAPQRKRAHAHPAARQKLAPGQSEVLRIKLMMRHD